MRVYVTEAETSGLVSENVSDKWLKRASLDVENALVGVVYSTTREGIPAQSDVLDAVKLAIAYQGLALQTRDARSQAQQASGLGNVTEAKIGSATYKVGEASSDLMTIPYPGALANVAIQVLRAAGLQQFVGYAYG